MSQLSHSSPSTRQHLLSCTDCCIEKDDIWLDLAVFDVWPQMRRAQSSKNTQNGIWDSYRNVIGTLHTSDQSKKVSLPLPLSLSTCFHWSQPGCLATKLKVWVKILGMIKLSATWAIDCSEDNAWIHYYLNSSSLPEWFISKFTWPRPSDKTSRLATWEHFVTSLVLCPTTAGCALSLYCFFILRPTSCSVFKDFQTEWSFSHFQPPNEGRSVVPQWIFHGDSTGILRSKQQPLQHIPWAGSFCCTDRGATHLALNMLMPISLKSCGYGPKMNNNGQQMSEWYHNYINMATTDLLTWRSSCSSWSSTSSPPKNDQTDQNDGDQNNLRPELQAMTSGVNCCLSRSRWIKTNDVCSWFGIDYIKSYKSGSVIFITASGADHLGCVRCR